MLDGEDCELMYLRLTNAEIAAAGTEKENPYRKINFKEHTQVELEPIPKTNAYLIKDKTGENELVLGEARSIASFHNLRGADFYSIKEIYVDEFIPAESVRLTPEIKLAGYLFMQAYETINRNRELEGEPPVKVIMTANAFSLDSSILAEFGLIDVIEQMQRTGQKRFTDREASIYIELLESADIAEAKKETALYKATRRNAKIANVNISNKFTDAALSLTKKNVKLIEYTPVFSFNDELTLYAHKSSGAWHFVGRGDQNAKEIYPRDARGKLELKWGAVIRMAMQDRAFTCDSAATYYLTARVFDKTLKVY